jgi:hypothetical protein
MSSNRKAIRMQDCSDPKIQLGDCIENIPTKFEKLNLFTKDILSEQNGCHRYQFLHLNDPSTRQYDLSTFIVKSLTRMAIHDNPVSQS